MRQKYSLKLNLLSLALTLTLLIIIGLQFNRISVQSPQIITSWVENWVLTRDSNLMWVSPPFEIIQLFDHLQSCETVQVTLANEGWMKVFVMIIIIDNLFEWWLSLL